MGSIRKEILTKAGIDAVWSAIRDVGALHTRLVPGFVTDTRLILVLGIGGPVRLHAAPASR
jgi:hypothetical protein